MYTLPNDEQIPQMPAVRRIRNDGWSRGEVQIMGLAAVVFIMTVVFLGISFLNCVGRLRKQRQQLQGKERKAFHLNGSPSHPEQHIRGGRTVF